MLQMVQTETCHDEETAKSTNKAHTMMHHQQPSIVYNNNTILTSSNTIRNSMDVKQTYFSSPMIPFLPFLSNKNLLHHTRDDYENESVTTNPTTNHHQPQKQQLTRHYTLRNFAMDASLYVNVAILAIKLIVYIETLSLSVLAALVDSALDVVSQLILNYTEKRSSLHRSSALYPAGASRLEPLGVLICAALMGMASFEVLKESIQALYVEGTLRYSLTHPMNHSNTTTTNTTSSQAQLDSIIHEEMDRLSHFTASFWGMIGIIIVKYGLWLLCKRAAHYRNYQPTSSSSSFVMEESVTGVGAATTSSTTALLDPTLDALAQDHKNDCLSNIVAAVALLSMLLSKDSLWYLDPFGALIISIYIIHSWYETAKEQIEQLTGKCAPVEFIDELYTIANTFDPKILLVDVVRAYHFGPKFLVELEVVLSKDTPLIDSHDLGMDLQYEIESRPQVERCFVHIDYEAREYDEHVVSKVPELMARYRPSRKVAYMSADSSSFSSDDMQDGLVKLDDEEAKLDRKGHCYGSTKNHHIM